MLENEKYGEGERGAEWLGTSRDVVRPEMSFLSENPEAFGLVSDARPLATKHLLIAANGHPNDGGSGASSCDVACNGPDELYDFYGDLLTRDEETDTALAHAFGEGNTVREQPVSRYCAVLAELTALRVLNGLDEQMGYAEALSLLNDELSWSLHALRERVEDATRAEIIHDAAFEPTVGICRVRESGSGDYVVDIFSAGDFRMYLLDEQGMAPLWTTVTPSFSPERNVGLTGKSLKIHHPAPFAVLLVSESICALNAAEYRSLRGDPGLAWRYRMRLEDYFLRVMTDCVRETEFGERAARFFVGRSHGRDSASGAMTVLRNGVSYENFHLLCQNRLSALGRQMELLPNGYDIHNVPAPEAREEVERKHLQRLLDGSADLSDRLANALRIQILRKYGQAEGTEPIPLPEDAPAYLRLNASEIRAAVKRLDRENSADRARIAENHGLLRESLAEHWITLRPVLLASREADADCRGYRDSNDRIYGICLDMNRRLAEMKAKRKDTVEGIRELMARSLEIAAAESDDWVGGRAGWDSVSAWMAPLEGELPARLARMSGEWQADTQRFRSLLTAYTAQREDLFRRDVLPEGGAFAAQWEAMLTGKLPDALWNEWRASLTAAPETAGFGEFLDALRRISKGTGVLLARIQARAVENRVARELANQPALRVAALRGAAYEDADWGEEIISVLDNAARGEFRNVVRRWKETSRRIQQQKEAFEAYSAMYGAYGP